LTGFGMQIPIITKKVLEHNKLLCLSDPRGEQFRGFILYLLEIIRSNIVAEGVHKKALILRVFLCIWDSNGRTDPDLIGGRSRARRTPNVVRRTCESSSSKVSNK
jgi:hypothetical protein